MNYFYDLDSNSILNKKGFIPIYNSGLKEYIMEFKKKSIMNIKDRRLLYTTKSNEYVNKYFHMNTYDKSKYPIFNQLIKVYVYQYVSISWWDEWDCDVNTYCYLTDCGKIYELFEKNNKVNLFISIDFNNLLRKYNLKIWNCNFKNEIVIDTNKNIFGHNKQFTIYKKFLRKLMNLLKYN